jgi:hypothetical protein
LNNQAHTEYQCVTYNDYTVIFFPKEKKVKIYLKDQDLSYSIAYFWAEERFREYASHLYDNQGFKDDLIKKLIELFELVIHIRDTVKNGELYCHLSTHIFECLSHYSQFLNFSQLYSNNLRYLRFILNEVYKWEEPGNNKVLHKGTLYGYLGNLYMVLADVELGFTFFHRAVLEDVRISTYIKEYPKEAPSYKTVMLNRILIILWLGMFLILEDCLKKS